MLKKIAVAQRTDVGRKRQNNEDRVYGTLTTHPSALKLGIEAILLVADGVGGHQRGEAASTAAVHVVQELFHSEEFLSQHNYPSDALREAVIIANEEVYQLAGEGSSQRPGSTMTLAALGTEKIWISHVGDSRAYLVSNGRAVQLTQDDSFVEEAVRSGEMTEEQARTSRFRNQLTKCLGHKPDLSPFDTEAFWMPGDVVYLCSDGLSEYVSGEDSVDVFAKYSDLDSASEQMIYLANEGGGHDNISVAVGKYLATFAAPSVEPTAKPLKAKSTGERPNPNLFSPQKFLLLSLIAVVISFAAGYVTGFMIGSKAGNETVASKARAKASPKSPVNGEMSVLNLGNRLQITVSHNGTNLIPRSEELSERIIGSTFTLEKRSTLDELERGAKILIIDANDTETKAVQLPSNLEVKEGLILSDGTYKVGMRRRNSADDFALWFTFQVPKKPERNGAGNE